MGLSSVYMQTHYFLIIFVPINRFPWNLNLALIFTLVIENKGYGILIHDTMSIYARSKCSSKGIAFVLLFFISKSQCVYFIHSAIFVGESGTFQRHVIFRFWSDSNGIVFFELFFLVRTLNTVFVSRALVPQTQTFFKLSLVDM